MRNRVHLAQGQGAAVHVIRHAVVLATLFLFSFSTFGQTGLTCDGNTIQADYTGTAQDFIVPLDMDGALIEFTAKGGDGGFARIKNTIPILGNMQVCASEGGQGATATATFAVGQGSDEIPPGSHIRFIVGGKGEDADADVVLANSFQYGGGGGGTAILLQRPSGQDWELLMAAGGGGGAYQGMAFTLCVDNEDGQGGQAGTAGGNGNGDIAPGSGGADGQGGGAGGLFGVEIGGGGGGANTDGRGITCITIQIPPTVSEVGQGMAGLSIGGPGGEDDGCTGFNFRSGGYGFGGGGAGFGSGGGGGGYSGGGGGGTTGRGGGGGSFVHPMAVSRNISAGGSTPAPENGIASYQCILQNTTPEALCISTPAVISLDDSGTATLSPTQLDGGSFDPDGDELFFSLSQSSFDCSQAGIHEVTLFVEDGSGAVSSCTATVTVQDDTEPEIACPDNITVKCNEPTGPAHTGLAIALDNCGALAAMDFTDIILEGDCEQECTMERTFTATDAWGNSSRCSHIITRTAAGLFEEALSADLNGDGLSDPIVLGYSRRTLAITEEAVDCVINWLPGAGGSPAPLPLAQRVIDGSDCQSGIPLSADGRINNPLLAEALLLAVNVRVNPQLGNTQLSSLDCSFHPILNQFLGNSPTVNNLLRLANLSLGNVLGPVPFSAVRDAMFCINNSNPLCGTEEAPLARPPFSSGNSAMNAPVSAGLDIYPNPAASSVHFGLAAFSGKAGVMRIYNMQGQLVEERRFTEIPEGQVEWPVSHYQNGLYIATLYVEGRGMQTGAFVVEP